jgi:hemerythrin-like domain-containing protein
MIAPMTATAALRLEHTVILKALDVLEAAAERRVAAESVPEATWSALLDWLRSFADARHHAKEERLLFPALEAAGVPRAGGPIEVMLEEHERGRALVREMRGVPAARRGVLARDFVRLLREHIAKEDQVLFELADAVLDLSAVEALVQAYAAADLEQGAATAPEAAEVALERLAATLRAGVLAG